MFSFVLGTRPEIIKLAPLLRRCIDQSIPFTLIHSNQHYDDNMDRVFFDELQLPQPTTNLGVGSCTRPAMIRSITDGCIAVWEKGRPSCVIVQGDTNTVLAGAIAADALDVPVAHVEAGLRSDDRTMPEETNRILTDHVAARLYTPTRRQTDRLLQEDIAPDHIFETGNTIADAVHEHRKLAKDHALPFELPASYVLMTLHRPALVDDQGKLSVVLQQIDAALAELETVGMFLVHPRTKKTVDQIGGTYTHLQFHEPVGYLPMLRLLTSAKGVITDSGGLQEETALLQIPCVTVRNNTERPETLEAGGNILASPESDSLSSIITIHLSSAINWKPLYSIENPSDTIINDLLSHYG